MSLPRDTLVHLKRGLVPIQNVEVGDMTFTDKGSYRVTNVLVQGKNKLIRINTSIGPIDVSETQKIKIRKGDGSYQYIPANELQSSMRISISNHLIDNVGNKPPNEMNGYKAHLLAKQGLHESIPVDIIYGEQTSRKQYLLGILQKQKTFHRNELKQLHALAASIGLNAKVTIKNDENIGTIEIRDAPQAIASIIDISNTDIEEESFNLTVETTNEFVVDGGVYVSDVN